MIESWSTVQRFDANEETNCRCDKIPRRSGFPFPRRGLWRPFSACKSDKTPPIKSSQSCRGSSRVADDTPETSLELTSTAENRFSAWPCTHYALCVCVCVCVCVCPATLFLHAFTLWRGVALSELLSTSASKETTVFHIRLPLVSCRELCRHCELWTTSLSLCNDDFVTRVCTLCGSRNQWATIKEIV